MKFGVPNILIYFVIFIILSILTVFFFVKYGRAEGYYPYAGPVWGGPWNLPTRDLYYSYPYAYGYGYPYGYSNKWFYDIRGPPNSYPPTELPAPNPSENTTDVADGQQGKEGPVSNNAILRNNKKKQVAATATTVTESADIPENLANNRRVAAEEYERESKWWPGWARWDSGWWGPFFNYGVVYDVDGKLKNSRNNSIVANHAWPWSAWWW